MILNLILLIILIFLLLLIFNYYTCEKFVENIPEQLIANKNLGFLDSNNPEKKFIKYNGQTLDDFTAVTNKDREGPIFQGESKYYKRYKLIDDKPIIGATVSYNKDSGKIFTLQYLYDKNEIHNPTEYSPELFGGDQGKFGSETVLIDGKKQYRDSEKHTFICRPNSAVYKVDTVYDNEGIKGLRFFCQDITTGKMVKSLDTENRYVYGVVFGKTPRPDVQSYLYDSTECKPVKVVRTTIDENAPDAETPKKNFDYYPSYFSRVGASFDDDSVKGLIFDRCSYYKDY